MSTCLGNIFLDIDYALGPIWTNGNILSKICKFDKSRQSIMSQWVKYQKSTGRARKVHWYFKTFKLKRLEGYFYDGDKLRIVV